ncbi:protein containg PAS domain S-box [Longilinea arvoryzae]|uniref:Circadian input-output histidine kinase CikA n=1 Tax=Longilinea arvoryzae TaxID=360412 RepID=A0A0K8MZB4_9CHLR|nr:response regulator [Longilinea arvoryzae]GAP15972.1 protein containg PAS domain S-box [Longilinea arvoryzae]
MSTEKNSHRNGVYRRALQGILLGWLLAFILLAITFPFLPQLLADLPPAQRLLLLVMAVFVTPAGLGWVGQRLDRQERTSQALQERISHFENQEQENQLQEASRSQLEKILERGKREWEGIFDAVQNAILVTDASGQIIRCNRPAIQWLNNSFDHVIHQPIDSLDLGRMDGHAIRLRDCAGETFLPEKGGWYDISRFDILLDEDNQGLIFIVKDINQRKRDEAIIRQQKEYLETLVDLSPVAIVTLDLEKRIQSSNPYFETLFGYSREEVTGRPLAELLNHNGNHPEGNLTPDIPASGEMVKSAVRLQRKDGAMADVESLGVPLVQDNQVKGALWLFHDITELVQARRAAEQADRAKSEFLANMSHEIRTPMNGIIGMIELAMDTELSDEQYDYLEGARESADALLSVLNSVLDFSKIESGQLALDPVDFDLVGLVEGVAQIMAGRAESRGLELLAYIDPLVPANVRGDSVRLRQVLVNLLDNALKFTEKGAIVIRCTLEKKKGSDALVKFSVTDSGIGIPEERQKDIFERFVQVDGSTTRKYGGTGLGLAISKQLAELMGGQIGVESNKGKGSTFWFTAGLEELPKSAAGEPLTTRDLKRVRVLIVDDSATNRQIFSKMMEGLGCQVTAVSSGQDVIPALFRGLLTNAHFHLVLLDMQMPGMDGEETLRAIRNEPLTRDTRVVVMTSMGHRNELSKLDALGYSGFLQKPIKQSQLQSTVEYALGLTPHLDSRQRADGLQPRTGEQQLEILVAEDNEINQKMVCSLLVKRGHRVELAANGLEAVNASQKKHYDVILMDVQMPDLDGFAASRQIRAASGPNQQTPIIAMTAHAMPGDRQRCLDAGMVDYVSKPIDTRKLFQILERWTSATMGKDPENPAQRGKKNTPAVDTILDMDGALKRFSDDRSFYQSLLDEFLQTLPQKIAEMQGAYSQGNLKQLAFLAHNLKGVAANFGAGQLYGLTASLDDASKKQDAEAAGLILTEMEITAGKLKNRVAEIFINSQK